MSIQTKDRNNVNLDLASSNVAGVEVPISIVANPAGTPISVATETTLAALLSAAQAIQTAAESLNTKTTAVNTGAVAGTVEVTNDIGSPLPVSAASLPLPAGAATDAAVQQLVAAVKAEDSASASGDMGVVVLAQRHDTDATLVSTDGDYGTLKSDEEGRLKVSTKPASYAAITGNVTSATSAVFVDTRRFSNIMIHCTGTFAGVNCTFEGSLNSTDGTDGSWFGVQAIRTNANTIETTTGVLAAAPAYAWELSVNALKYFRVRATAWTSGTQVWTMIPGTYATEPIPGAQISGTQPVSGTVTATVTAGTVNPVVPATPYILNSAATTNGALVLTGTSGLHAFYATNTGATAAFVKLFNKATAPTVGTDVPALILPVPAAVSGVPGVCTLPIGFSGFRFALGLGIAITGAVGDTDTTAVAAGQVKVMLSRTV